jgi:hypothetical protein
MAGGRRESCRPNGRATPRFRGKRPYARVASSACALAITAIFGVGEKPSGAGARREECGQGGRWSYSQNARDYKTRDYKNRQSIACVRVSAGPTQVSIYPSAPVSLPMFAPKTRGFALQDSIVIVRRPIALNHISKPESELTDKPCASSNASFKRPIRSETLSPTEGGRSGSQRKLPSLSFDAAGFGHGQLARRD